MAGRGFPHYNLALERFYENGVPMAMMEDNVVIAGPSWLEFGLEYNERIVDGKVDALESKSKNYMTWYKLKFFHLEDLIESIRRVPFGEGFTDRWSSFHSSEFP